MLFEFRKAKDGKPAVYVVDTVQGDADALDLFLGKGGVADPVNAVGIRVDDEADARLHDLVEFFIGELISR